MGPLSMKTENDNAKRRFSHVSQQEERVFHQPSNPKRTLFSKRCSNKSSYKGKIALVNEPVISRGMWKLAGIKEIKRGRRDGEVRNVSIELPQGNIPNRLVNKLYLLEINDEAACLEFFNY
ncbi:hypothetical protein WUBG_15669 [Wuchereria bancrofti]|uniref:DUF5641 domain-containing protein n=1 Tax=Wuchereria bancrofti TaxID=6293 RepID=J9E8V6_WUCBA|nr:hypothetical protein WUBG_15669 [Wuchereria bancrofti]